MEHEQEKAGLTHTLHHLQGAGWHPRQLDDGGLDRIDVWDLHIDDVVEQCAAVAECTLFFRNGNFRGTLYLIWGNSPEELIADHSECEGFSEAVDLATAQAFPEAQPVPTVDDLVQQADGDYGRRSDPRGDWKNEVSRDETLLGYWDWVRSKIEAER